jgi:hypothetical protein
MRVKTRLAKPRRNEVYKKQDNWPVLTRPEVAEFNPPGDTKYDPYYSNDFSGVLARTIAEDNEKANESQDQKGKAE